MQEPQIVHLPPDVHSLAAALEALELAESVGMTPDDSQRFTLNAALGERKNGSWAAFEVCDVEPRQNGKGDTIEIRELAGLFLFGERLIIHTAHEFPTANEAFLRMVARIDGNPDLSRHVKQILFGSGTQGIELMSGARLKYRARTPGSGRGFAGANLVVLDESYTLKAKQIAAMLPTLSTGVNPQVWFASSGGFAESSQLWALRKRALAGNAGRLAFCEHTAEDLSLDEDGNVVSRPIDIADRRLWALANPAAGVRISWEYLEAEFAAMPPEQFARERLGVWDPEPQTEDARPAKMVEESWMATRSKTRPQGQMVFGVAVGRNSADAAIAVAIGDGSDSWVGLVAFDRGVSWLNTRLVDLVAAHHVRVVAFNNVGATAATVADLVGLGDVLVPLNGAAWQSACGGFVSAVHDGRLSRPFDQSPLDDAGNTAPERLIGDGWAWDSRTVSKVSITPLEAVTAARAALGMKPKVAELADLLVL